MTVEADIFVRGGALGTRTIHRSVVPAADTGLALVDLRGASWIEPVGLVHIATFIEGQLELGREAYVHGPTDFGIGNYASRMRLWAVLEDLGVDHDLRRVRERTQDGTLLELQRFNGERGAERLASTIFELLEDEEPAAASALYKALCEIGSNVPQHSGCDHGYLAAQVTHRGSQVSFAVGDSGLGLAHTLAPLYTGSETQLMDLVLQEGASRLNTAGRGHGIRSTRDILTRSGGTLYLATGSSVREAYALAVAGSTFSSTINGTLLQGTVRLATNTLGP